MPSGWDYLFCPRCKKPYTSGSSNANDPCRPVSSLFPDETVWITRCAGCCGTGVKFVEMFSFRDIFSRNPSLTDVTDYTNWLAGRPLYLLKCYRCSTVLTETGRTRPILFDCGHLICNECNIKSWGTPCSCNKPNKKAMENVDLSMVYRYMRDAIQQSKEIVGRFFDEGLVEKNRCSRCRLLCDASEGRAPNVRDCQTLICDQCWNYERLTKICSDCNRPCEEHVKWGKRTIYNDKANEQSTAAKARPEVQIKVNVPAPTEEANSIVKCSTCLTSCSAATLIVCKQCADVILCGSCALSQHLRHDLTLLQTVRSALLEASTNKDLKIHYDGLFANIKGQHAMIQENQTKLLTNVENGLKRAGVHPDFAECTRICDGMRQTAEQYEKCFELYLPHARIYNANLEKLQDATNAFMKEFQVE